MSDIFLDQEFIEDFKKWLQLKWEGVTWFGKFQEDFDQFWAMLFSHPLEIQIIYQRQSDLLMHIGQGPVHSWMKWLLDRFLCYLFIRKNFSIGELAQAVGMSFQDLSLVLRNFLVEAFPHLEDEFGDIFLNGNILSPNLKITYQQIQNEFKLDSEFVRSGEDEVMTALEVTLYPEWKIILGRLSHRTLKTALLEIPTKEAVLPLVKFPWKFIRDLAVLIIVGFGVLQGIKSLNQYYERSVVDKISIFEPDFLWLNKKLSFKDISNQPSDIQISLKEFEDLENTVASPWEENTIEAEREGTESEATVTTWSDLPRDLEKSTDTLSPFEESDRENLRDTAFGNRKIFRVMLRSIIPEEKLVKINEIMAQFGAKQVDKVRPGQEVPGGYYYNLYVPLEAMREFLGQVSYVDDSIIFESKTRGDNPAGMGRVFIWVKKI